MNKTLKLPSSIISSIKKQKIKVPFDLLATWGLDTNYITVLLETALWLQKRYRQQKETEVFRNGLAVSWFRDHSTRTRFSFASAADLLGLSVQEINEDLSQIAHGETVRETATMISFLSRFIGIRDDIFLGKGHTFLQEVSTSVAQAFAEKTIPHRTGVINLQSDVDHPTQSLSDLLHLQQEFGGLKKLKGKKLVMSWAYSPSYGKPLSVPQGVCGLMPRFGMDVVLAYPKGYQLIPELEQQFAATAKKEGTKFSITHDMNEAFSDADIVYPKSWAPYEVMVQRTALLEKKDTQGLKELEKAALAQNAKHQDWQCARELMNQTKQKSALYLHCLPADISGVSCKVGEVSQDVFDQYRVQLYRQAGYKPYIIAAQMLLSQLFN